MHSLFEALLGSDVVLITIGVTWVTFGFESGLGLDLRLHLW